MLHDLRMVQKPLSPEKAREGIVVLMDDPDLPGLLLVRLLLRRGLREEIILPADRRLVRQVRLVHPLHGGQGRLDIVLDLLRQLLGGGLVCRRILTVQDILQEEIAVEHQLVPSPVREGKVLCLLREGLLQGPDHAEPFLEMRLLLRIILPEAELAVRREALAALPQEGAGALSQLVREDPLLHHRMIGIPEILLLPGGAVVQ